MRHAVVIAIAALVAAPTPAAAQFCFRGRPRPACSTFLISEFLVGSRFSESQYAQTLVIAHWEYGLMANVGDRTAVGGTALGTITGGGGRLALKARYRRWLGSSWSLDVAPGVVVAASSGGQDADLRGPGFSGHLGLMWRDLAGVSLLVEAVPFRQPETGIRGTDAALGIGGRLGSPVGGIVGAAAFLGLVIVSAHLASITS
jgi:hypothetical protein